MKSKNVASANTIIHEIIFRNSWNPSSGRISSGPKQDTSGERDRDARDRIRRGKHRVAAMIPKTRFSASPVITISVEGLLPERVFMIDTGAEPNY